MLPDTTDALCRFILSRALQFRVLIYPPRRLTSTECTLSAHSSAIQSTHLLCWTPSASPASISGMRLSGQRGIPSLQFPHPSIMSAACTCMVANPCLPACGYFCFLVIIWRFHAMFESAASESAAASWHPYRT